MSNFLTISEVTGGYPVGAPRIKTADTADSLATITTAGYMNDQVAANLTSVNDLWYVNYAVGGVENSQLFTVEFSTPNYSLVPFSATAGAVVQTGASVVGNLPKYNTTSGGVTDSGISPSNAALTKVACVTGSGGITANHFTQFSDANGSIQSGGASLMWGITATYAGGGTSNAYVATGLTTGSTVVATIFNSTNAVSIVKVNPSANTLTVYFSADPGAGTTVSWIALTP